MIFIVNGIQRKALYSSVQSRGCSVIDYIICDQKFYEQTKKFKTWDLEFSIIGDHRILTVEVIGKLGKKSCEIKELKELKEIKEIKKGWRRKISDQEKFQQVCDSI